MSDEVPICRNCEHHRLLPNPDAPPPPRNPRWHEPIHVCAYFSTFDTDIVTGEESIKNPVECREARENPDRCGREGRWFSNHGSS